jgi:hypothetical protein
MGAAGRTGGRLRCAHLVVVQEVLLGCGQWGRARVPRAALGGHSGLAGLVAGGAGGVSRVAGRCRAKLLLGVLAVARAAADRVGQRAEQPRGCVHGGRGRSRSVCLLPSEARRGARWSAMAAARRRRRGQQPAVNGPSLITPLAPGSQAFRLGSGGGVGRAGALAPRGPSTKRRASQRSPAFAAARPPTQLEGAPATSPSPGSPRLPHRLPQQHRACSGCCWRSARPRPASPSGPASRPGASSGRTPSAAGRQRLRPGTEWSSWARRRCLAAGGGAGARRAADNRALA